ncbi:MAG: hypothetical protein NC342_08820 [Pseudoflavonifractor sp.]|nr:hypothetical protein [Alloprevotella sp.]MCM1117623.1 hypothetical protein [Pseudoflavonifractor sp.]
MCVKTMEPGLKKSPVTFDELAHRYFMPDGRELRGITGLLKRQLFADKYAGIPDETLSRAAEYGSNVHEQIELYDAFGGEAANEVTRVYQAIKDEHGLETEANEYLVSDEETFASSIDIVFKGGHLCDIKTTSSLDREYVSWQLSIYAHLYERQNPGRQAGRLLALWIPKARYGRPRLVEVERKPDIEVAALLAADAAGFQYEPPKGAGPAPGSIAHHASLLAALYDAQLAYDKSKAEVDRLRGIVLAVMTKSGEASYKDSRFALTRKEGTETRRVDSTRLKTEWPEVYESCLTVTKTRPSLTIRMKEEV